MRPTVATTLLACVSICVLDLALAYPEMVPESACDRMRPGHHQDKNWSMPLIDPQMTEPYFSIHLSTYNDIMPGESVVVTIKADQHYFEGFLIQAHGHNEDIWGAKPPMRHGVFLTYTADTQLACWSQAVSHNTHKHYDSAEFMWTAPNVKEPTPIQFTATIVKGYTTFFMGVQSKPVWLMPYNMNAAPGEAKPVAAGLLFIVAMVTLLVGKH